MKTKKQKLPSKPRTIGEITGKPSRFKKFLKETSKTQQKQHSESLGKAIEIVSRNGKKRIKAARKPHTEVFDGYGVMIENPNNHLLSHSAELKFFTRHYSCALGYAKELKSHVQSRCRVVKLRVEFKVI